MSIFVRLDGKALHKALYGQTGAMVGRGGLEPPTSRLSGVRSNHLSYRPIFAPHLRRGGLVEPIGIEPMTS